MIGLITAMLLVARLSTWTPVWEWMTRWSIAAAIGVSAGGLLFLVAPESLQALQRWIYFVSLSWLVAIAIMALRTTRQGSA